MRNPQSEQDNFIRPMKTSSLHDSGPIAETTPIADYKIHHGMTATQTKYMYYICTSERRLHRWIFLFLPQEGWRVTTHSDNVRYMHAYIMLHVHMFDYILEKSFK